MGDQGQNDCQPETMEIGLSENLEEDKHLRGHLVFYQFDVGICERNP